MEDVIRIGYVSSFNNDNHMARIYYPDRGNTTAELPLFSFRAEFAPLEVGEQVIVLHLSNDTSSGIILGKFWDQKNIPEKTDYYKKITQNAYEIYQDNAYIIHAPEIKIEGNMGSITLSKLIELEQRVEELERRGDD